jgi:hypothetical protein
MQCSNPNIYNVISQSVKLSLHVQISIYIYIYIHTHTPNKCHWRCSNFTTYSSLSNY